MGQTLLLPWELEEGGRGGSDIDKGRMDSRHGGGGEEERHRDAVQAMPFCKKNMSLNDKICTHMLVELGKHGRIADLVGKGPKASCMHVIKSSFCVSPKSYLPHRVT